LLASGLALLHLKNRVHSQFVLNLQIAHTRSFESSAEQVLERGKAAAVEELEKPASRKREVMA
jgi:hypothetical protein